MFQQIKNLKERYFSPPKLMSNEQNQPQKFIFLQNDKYNKIYHELLNFDFQSKNIFSLPRIAVIGSQSSGKSSVLESIIGIDILPKGQELTTRCPIIINLNKTTHAEYATVNLGRELQLSEVKTEIISKTNEKCGKTLDISDKEIIVHLFLTDSIQVTFIDLPGFTKIPIGEQPDNIEEITRNLAFQYIKNEDTIILAISPANVDLVNSESLKLARAVDPQGKRTLGVITKIDMMDNRTDCSSILENKVFKLRNGYVGVINRSVTDHKDGKTLKESHQSEKIYFKKHKTYKIFFPEIGTEFLKAKLELLFQTYLKEKLPVLKDTLKKRLKIAKKEYFSKKSSSASAHFYVKEYSSALQNLFLDQRAHLSVFRVTRTESFLSQIKNLFDNVEYTKFSFEDRAIRNEIETDRFCLFNQQQNFETIVRKYVSVLEMDYIRTLKAFRSLFTQKLDLITTDSHDTFLEVAKKITLHKFDKEFENREAKIHDYFKIEKTQINTSDKNLNPFKLLLEIIFTQCQESSLLPNEIKSFFGMKKKSCSKTSLFQLQHREKDILIQLLNRCSVKYCLIVRKNVLSYVCNSVIQFVEDFVEQHSTELWKKTILFSKKICYANEEYRQDLKNCKSQYKGLNNAVKILKDL